jgi:hypothetical protein
MKLAPLAIAAIASSLCACAAVEPACPPGLAPAASDVLYFGTAKPDGDWDAFLRDVVTPRFPEGFTAWRAAGQWRSADGRIVREGSYVLSIVHPEDAKADAAIRAIAGEYKTRFRQEAVLRVESRTCVSY